MHGFRRVVVHDAMTESRALQARATVPTATGVSNNQTCPSHDLLGCIQPGRLTYRERPILRRCFCVSSGSAKSIGAGPAAAPKAWFRRSSDFASDLRSDRLSARSAVMSAVVGASGARDNTRRPAVVIRTDARRRSAGSVARSTHPCACKRSTTSATELRSVNVRAASSLSERLSSVRNCCRTNSCAALTPATACVR